MHLGSSKIMCRLQLTKYILQGGTVLFFSFTCTISCCFVVCQRRVGWSIRSGANLTHNNDFMTMPFVLSSLRSALKAQLHNNKTDYSRYRRLIHLPHVWLDAGLSSEYVDWRQMCRVHRGTYLTPEIYLRRRNHKIPVQREL